LSIRPFVAITSLMLAAPTLDAACFTRSGTQRARLVELYTSEGCSSCPPADAWLRTLRADATLVPLAFHVDYWDSLGWRDPYASPRFTLRQREVAARSRRGVVYTPEVALDGREWRGWRGARISPATAPPSLSLALELERGATLDVRVTAAAPAFDPAWRAYLALIEDGLVSEVRAGENDGRTLAHDHVVRAFAGPLALDAARASWPVPPGLVRERASVVAFVQHPGTGEVLQVVRTALAACEAEAR